MGKRKYPCMSKINAYRWRMDLLDCIIMAKLEGYRDIPVKQVCKEFEIPYKWVKEWIQEDEFLQETFAEFERLEDEPSNDVLQLIQLKRELKGGV